MKQFSALAVLLGLFVVSLYILFVPVPLPPPEQEYREIPLAQLNGWNDDEHDKAFQSFQISCTRLLRYPDTREYNGFGLAADWKPACEAASLLENANAIDARAFFESHFTALSFMKEEEGLFTGYYAPLYKGSKTRSEQYSAPLYAIPNDLQALNLGDFDQRLKGRSIIGEVENGKFVPYKDRKEIAQGALNDQNLELVWLEKEEDSFFLQIQGSGFIELESGEIMHMGYAQRNGRPYRAIGQFLIESGDVAREDMSLQAILDWMMKNPEKSDELMWKNPSYVFFQERKTDKPVGSLGVGLTPGRSLAVDRSHIPLGMPLWLETYQETATDNETMEQVPHLKRLVIAQDTGGAIKGKVRGDVYWGIGDEAELKAGPMKDRGMYYLLVPKKVAADILSGTNG
ncbi:murein transglycosylase A [Pseudemcibacter aquimaris]|uniref:murein transglycosylase A n=1 Tax=Pseudemcibacter aquimaris TaxID=2857064 RepID=UPI0020130607|nr:MltA domain-containing protein [Pseudemcibacter aquimaris]MCC3861820.1 MltA domain-containing protein [Pseudemcibacter aquimaris]WDU58575.1 MltA domain-containing protein [Pseudemcibacter aquimaris]